MSIERIEALAARLGLEAVGVAPAIDEVRQTYPWANSVLVAAICCLPPDRPSDPTRPTAAVARFAQSADYHAVLRAKLAIVAEAITNDSPDAKLEICVDTAPLPERKLAVLAGIATRGKSGNVFVNNCGSYAALGEIVTSLDLPIGTPISLGFEACGDCTLCMDSCPTRAITAPGQVDESRCVSRLTQMPGTIPTDLRPAISDRIYGCDTCQHVCPRNAGVTAHTPEFAEDTFPGPRPDLLQLIVLSPSDFAAQVKPSSIGWIRRTRIRRNACIVAGNTNCAEAIDALIHTLKDQNPVLRSHAAWALGRITSPQAISALNQALTSEQDPSVIKEITAALANK